MGTVTHEAARRIGSAALVLALAVPANARAVEPAAPAPAPTSAPSIERLDDPQPTQPTWDEVLGDQATPPPPVVDAPVQPMPTPAPAPAPLPPPTAQQVEDTRRLGNGLLIGAGITSAVGTLLNGLRVYIVTGPCQTDSQDGCSLGWFVATPFTFGTNIAAAALAGAGARERGTADAWLKPQRQRGRAAMLLALGIPLLCLGIATSVTMRGLWLADYSSPEGQEMFDFSRPSHAFAYYGVQQMSALAFASGIGMVSYSLSGSRERRRYNMASPWLGRGVVGLQMRARF